VLNGNAEGDGGIAGVGIGGAIAPVARQEELTDRSVGEVADSGGVAQAVDFDVARHGVAAVREAATVRHDAALPVAGNVAILLHVKVRSFINNMA